MKPKAIKVSPSGRSIDERDPTRRNRAYRLTPRPTPRDNVTAAVQLSPIPRLADVRDPAIVRSRNFQGSRHDRRACARLADISLGGECHGVPRECNASSRKRVSPGCTADVSIRIYDLFSEPSRMHHACSRPRFLFSSKLLSDQSRESRERPGARYQNGASFESARERARHFREREREREKRASARFALTIARSLARSAI